MIYTVIQEKKMKYITQKALRLVSLLWIAALILGSLVSCSQEKPEDTLEYIEFTDALGRTVKAQKEPSRVAALLGSFADVWLLSGGDLCAAAEDAFEDIGLSLPNAVNIGGAHSPSLELLLSADPQLVIASASTASNVEMLDTLEAVGITVAYFDVDNFEDYLNMLDICTDITGRKDLYERNGTALKAQIDEIKLRYSGKALPNEERTVLLLRASATSVKAKGSSGTILGEMLYDMGCINIADSDKGLLEELSVEAVIRNEPRHIFVVTMGSNTEAAVSSVKDMINGSPVWSSLDAVKNGRVHIMEKELFNMKPNARWAEAYGILYEKLMEK